MQANTGLSFGEWFVNQLDLSQVATQPEAGPSAGPSTSIAHSPSPDSRSSRDLTPLTPTSKLNEEFPSPKHEDDPSDEFADNAFDAADLAEPDVANDGSAPANVGPRFVYDPVDGWTRLSYNKGWFKDKEDRSKKQV